MAGGIDWFRWHHGSVTDPKFQLVARKTSVSLPDVLAVWAYLLEKASAADFRGCFGEVDCEAIDCLFGFDDGTTNSILSQMVERKLIADEFIVAWDKRQPKKEDATAADRKRRQRERDHEAEMSNIVTQSMSRNVTQCHDREEERREEEIKPLTNPNGLVVASDADDALPASDLKSSTCPHQEIIALYHEILPQCPQVREWTPARATQLRARWNEDPARQNMAYWRRFFEYVKTCDFLVGIQPDSRKTPFFADLEWLVKQANFTKIRERKYEPR